MAGFELLVEKFPSKLATIELMSDGLIEPDDFSRLEAKLEGKLEVKFEVKLELKLFASLIFLKELKFVAVVVWIGKIGFIVLKFCSFTGFVVGIIGLI